MNSTYLRICCPQVGTRDVRRIGFQITADNYESNAVSEFGSAITTKNYVILEIKSRIILANRFYYALSRKIEKLKPPLCNWVGAVEVVLLYGAKAQALSKSNTTALEIYEMSQRTKCNMISSTSWL